MGHNNPAARGPYIIQALLILLAPIFFAASVYMVLGRIVRRTKAEAYSMIRVTWLTKLFVGGDVFCFLLQALGGGMLAGANTASEVSRGQDVILAGLVLQIIVFGFFVVVALVFHKRLRQRPTPTVDKGSFRWERFMLMLYAVSTLITFRNLFRVIEYAMGSKLFTLRSFRDCPRSVELIHVQRTDIFFKMNGQYMPWTHFPWQLSLVFVLSGMNEISALEVMPSILRG